MSYITKSAGDMILKINRKCNDASSEQRVLHLDWPVLAEKQRLSPLVLFEMQESSSRVSSPSDAAWMPKNKKGLQGLGSSLIFF